MSAIPPAWLSGVIQAHGAQDRAAQARQVDAADAARRTGPAEFDKHLQDVIENTDRDSQVYSDAEGSGSQGRSHSSPDEQPSTSDEKPSAEPTGENHIDLQA